MGTPSRMLNMRMENKFYFVKTQSPTVLKMDVEGQVWKQEDQ